MEKLPKDFSMGDIEDAVMDSIEVLHNLTAVNSFEGNLIFTDEHVYYIFMPGPGKLIGNAWKIGYDEIDGYKRTGIAGFRITLKTGEKLNFSNVFGRSRKRIIENLEAHL